MADTDGNTPDPLIEELVKRPWAFDFFRAVRLLESQRPGLPRIGFSLTPAEDPVRFWQRPSLRFAPAALDFVEPQRAGGVPRLAVNFFGLFGPNAPLPPHLTEYALERELHDPHDKTITAFFNIFHHRLLCFFYRAWAANQKSADLDRPADQRFATYIGSLFGIGMETLRERDAVPDRAKLFFTGRLACQTRNAEGLEAILREYFHIPAEVQQFIGRWLALPGDSRFQLGVTPESGVLGANTILGSRFWDSQLSFRMRFGPMSLADYIRMLPPEEVTPAEAAYRAAHGLVNGASQGEDSQPAGGQAAGGGTGGSGQSFAGHAGAGGDRYAGGSGSGGFGGSGDAVSGAGQTGAAGGYSGAGATPGYSHGGAGAGAAATGAVGLPGDASATGQHARFGVAPGATDPWSGRPTSQAGGASGGGALDVSTAPISPAAGAASGEPSFAELLRVHTAASAESSEAQGGGARVGPAAVSDPGTARTRGGLADSAGPHQPRAQGASARGGDSAAIPTVRRGEAYQRVKYWVLNYCGEHFFWDAQLVLRAEEVPATCLGRGGWLGYTTWLKTKPFSSDADELILNPPPD